MLRLTVFHFPRKYVAEQGNINNICCQKSLRLIRLSIQCGSHDQKHYGKRVDLSPVLAHEFRTNRTFDTTVWSVRDAVCSVSLRREAYVMRDSKDDDDDDNDNNQTQ